MQGGVGSAVVAGELVGMAGALPQVASFPGLPAGIGFLAGGRQLGSNMCGEFPAGCAGVSGVAVPVGVGAVHAI